MNLQKHRIGELDNSECCTMNTLFISGDINGNGLPDLVVCGRSGMCAWFENPGTLDGTWERHDIGILENIETGGTVYDVTGDGRGDLILGSDGGGREVFWLENPGSTGGEWKRHSILVTEHNQFHDTLVAVAGEDKRPALIVSNQGSGYALETCEGTFLYKIPIPADPRVSPWPEAKMITSRKAVPGTGQSKWAPGGMQPNEGLAIGDIDGDGVNEIVLGVHWFKELDGAWHEYQYAPDTYLTTRTAVADLDGDGKLEIIVAEGDAVVAGRPFSRLAWFKAGEDIHEMWTEHLLQDKLHDPHSLLIADIDGNGTSDILVGELGKWHKDTNEYDRPPEIFSMKNDGKANFTKVLLHCGTGIHEMEYRDFFGTGTRCVAGRPLFCAERWQIHLYCPE